MAAGIPDINHADRRVVEKALGERYGKRVTVERAASAICLDPESERGVEFVILRIATAALDHEKGCAGSASDRIATDLER
jgi:hypothetical protein